jgi:hypothetical protein
MNCWMVDVLGKAKNGKTTFYGGGTKGYTDYSTSR